MCRDRLSQLNSKTDILLNLPSPIHSPGDKNFLPVSEALSGGLGRQALTLTMPVT